MLTMQQQLRAPFFVLLSLPATAMGLALSIQISALSWLLSTQYGLALHEVGLVWAAGPLAGILGQLAVGYASDQAWLLGGRRRPFILAGGATAALMLFLLPRLDQVAGAVGLGSMLWVAVLVSLTLDLSINISFNPTRALIADVTPPGRARTRGYSWMQAVSGFWGVLAYVAGATLGNHALIGGGMLVVLAFSVLPVLFIAEPRQTPAIPAPGHAAPSGKAVQAGASGQLWRICLAHGCSWIGVQAMFVYIIAFVQQYLVAPGTPQTAGQTGQVIAIAFAVMNTVGFLLPVLLLEPLAGKLGRVRTQAACTAVMALGYLLIAGACRSPAALYALMALVGVGWAAIVSLPFAIVSEHAGPRRMGAFMGLFNLAVVLPQLAVSLVLGVVIERAPDKQLLFLICGAALALSSVLWLRVRDTGNVVE